MFVALLCLNKYFAAAKGSIESFLTGGYNLGMVCPDFFRERIQIRNLLRFCGIRQARRVFCVGQVPFPRARRLLGGVVFGVSLGLLMKEAFGREVAQPF